jgi:hypothetical protein
MSHRFPLIMGRWWIDSWYKDVGKKGEGGVKNEKSDE